MQRKDKPNKHTFRFRLSEDWISVVVGLAIVLIVWALSLSSIPWPLFGGFK